MATTETEPAAAELTTEMQEIPAKGAEGGATSVKVSDEVIQEEVPPLTYIDFFPQCFGSTFEGKEPTYAEFQSVMEQANQWLRSMPQFVAVKCETVEHKLNPTDYSLDPDTCFIHFSSHGKNIYLKALRVWLMPKKDSEMPVQQIAYITVLPDHTSGNLTATLASLVTNAAMRVQPEHLFPAFDSMATTMEKLNNHLQSKPLPGKILTVETVPFKVAESQSVDKLNTEATLWSESGKHSRMYLFGIRIFYVVGQPEFERIGHHDEVPECAQDPEGMGLRIKFAPFTKTVARAAVWLQDQHNMRAVNFQSIKLKAERPAGTGPYVFDPNVAGYNEAPSLVESRFVKFLRIFYVKGQKVDVPDIYSSTNLTTRLFVPVKRGTKSYPSSGHGDSEVPGERGGVRRNWGERGKGGPGGQQLLRPVLTRLCQVILPSSVQGATTRNSPGDRRGRSRLDVCRFL
ncbi:hypothetical protein BaRGS_00028470, partial [Batillaria attramentaria]